jgi:hypothetical protein
VTLEQIGANTDPTKITMSDPVHNLVRNQWKGYEDQLANFKEDLEFRKRLLEARDDMNGIEAFNYLERYVDAKIHVADYYS